VTTPTGLRRRKYVYGKTRDIAHDKWLRLHQEAKRGPVVTRAPQLGDYLRYWLEEVVKPNRSNATYINAELFVRLYISPGLGQKRIDRLRVRDVQTWLNAIPKTCQCCKQGKDARRSAKRQRCCATGECCNEVPSSGTISDIRSCLRRALNHAIREELITRNVAAIATVPAARRKKKRAWTSDEARRFLASAKADNDPLYAAYVLVLVEGMRKGEVLGLPVNAVHFDTQQLDIGYQLQRVGGQLVHRETKTETSESTLPFPGIVRTALEHRLAARDQDKQAAGEAWDENDLLFTTRYGTPIEPRNFNRSWDARIAKAGVPKITVHDGRRTCGSLLADLDVHPRVAMAILRHAQFAITMEIYTEVSNEATRAGLKKLGDSLQ
jgi:integrase